MGEDEKMKLEIFCPEDFISTKDLVTTRDVELHEVLKDWQRSFAAKQANAKINEWLKQNAKKVYGNIDHKTEVYSEFTEPRPLKSGEQLATHQALLICIESIDKCSHPPEKVRIEAGDSGTPEIYAYFYCECGKKVQPKTFEEIK